jgi:mannose-6-phosphate isomerase-like protein (cupin superfamily)
LTRSSATTLLLLLSAVPIAALRPGQATSNQPPATTASAGLKELAADGAHWKGQDIFGKGVLYTQSSPPQYTVYAQRRDQAGTIEVHEEDTDIIFFMGGGATFVTGGTVVGSQTLRPHELTGSDVQRGLESRVSRGDVFIVPKGTPHWFKSVAGSVSYYAIKVHEPDAMAVKPPVATRWTRAEAFAARSPMYDGGQAHRYQLFAVQRDAPAAPEFHENDTDIVFFLDGTGIWTIGGGGPGGAAAPPGTLRHVGRDDAVIVPPKVRHWFETVPGKLAYYAVKVY